MRVSHNFCERSISAGEVEAAIVIGVSTMCPLPSRKFQASQAVHWYWVAGDHFGSEERAPQKWQGMRQKSAISAVTCVCGVLLSGVVM